jgi:hypothetical protein
MGNDDCPSSDGELALLHAEMELVGVVGVVITNYLEQSTGQVVKRMQRSGSLGAGPRVAASNFRNFSFVSGVVLNGERARALTTDKWDGSEMYQMYLGTRIIAEGMPLLSVERVAVIKDIQIPSESVDSYASRPRLDPCPIVERKHTFHLLAPLVLDAITPSVPHGELEALREYVVAQVLMFTYPFWIFEFRRVQSWNYAAGICLGMRPRNLLRARDLGGMRSARVRLLYAGVTLAGLLAPVELFQRARPALHRIAKSRAGEVLLGRKAAQA